MKTLNIIFLILIYNVTVGQDTTMYMHSWKKPKKVDKVTNNLYINVDLVESDSIGKPIPTSYSGLLLYVRPNEIVMTIREEHIKEIKANGTKVKTSKSYNFPDSLKKISDGELRTININNIYSISHFTEKRISNVGGAIAGFSAFAALVIAPLVSINYKTGNFNQKIYYPVLAGCGLGFAIGIPLNVACRKNKYYKIKSYSPDPCDNNYYSIQTE